MAAIVEAKALPQILAAFAGRIKESVLDGISFFVFDITNFVLQPPLGPLHLV